MQSCRIIELIGGIPTFQEHSTLPLQPDTLVPRLPSGSSLVPRLFGTHTSSNVLSTPQSGTTAHIHSAKSSSHCSRNTANFPLGSLRWRFLLLHRLHVLYPTVWSTDWTDRVCCWIIESFADPYRSVNVVLFPTAVRPTCQSHVPVENPLQWTETPLIMECKKQIIIAYLLLSYVQMLT